MANSQNTQDDPPDPGKAGAATGASSGDPQEEATSGEDLSAELARLTDRWKRAMADAENARKRADAARADGREHGIAMAIEALAPAFDALALGLESARGHPEADSPRMCAHIEGLKNIKAAFETGLKALGVRMIEPRDTPFDPSVHEAMQLHETDEARPGHVLFLHRPGFAIGPRLIRPAHVTVSASPETERTGD
ncbi:nucleotide exchange factor GrpE [Oceanibium sediminis]|uniref:nucleotide exchange factor GrpE n=1 Tax=Oceanibium sediminis TaxID=2026339 RepID=UPI0013009BB1|nr:nucleotide exchange factor GrpE [Oceanibium sediminis]